MVQEVKCRECGCKEFKGPYYQYYSMTYKFECAECKATIKLNEYTEEE
jgi:hypothetical protein